MVLKDELSDLDASVSGNGLVSAQTLNNGSHTLIQNSDYQRALDRFINATIRGALSGLCLRGGLHAISLLFALLVKTKREEKAKAKNLWEYLKDTLRYSAFLGTFSGGFVAVDEGISAIVGKKK